jgi:serine/threonine-protein kinase
MAVMMSVVVPQLGDLLGEGATAHVYAAVDGQGGNVVVKVLKPVFGRDPVVRARFLREARAAAQVRHPRLVPVLDAGEVDGSAWLTLPYLRGGSLAQALQDGPLQPAAAVRLAEDLAGGLDALHRGGIVHRDLKPSNVLFDEDGAAYLADFGLAKDAAWTALTGDGAPLGTPHYLAPEVIAGSEAAPASDLYALGCVLWEALTGEPPFAGRSLFELGLAHLQESPPEPDLSAGAVFALRAALAKDPAARPKTAHALAALVAVGLSSGGRA